MSAGIKEQESLELYWLKYFWEYSGYQDRLEFIEWMKDQGETAPFDIRAAPKLK